jgi:hypothetical protein
VKLLAPFQPRVKGGGVITVVGDSPDQALYWELVSFDPATGLEGPPLGSLRWDHTRTDQAKLSLNIYLAPTDPALAGKVDRVKVRWGRA